MSLGDQPSKFVEGWRGMLYKCASVHVGKLYQKQVDFVCLREGEVLYVQVADSMADETTRERELAPLRAIADNHPKWIVVRQGSYPPDVDGIRIVRAADFFLRVEG